ncbi:hypothetical protein BGZ83_000500 [Gryganskiella cystojenkinii]|nr:hypothetical protein BGZ83_000500 [Gryganskiella cystojenkinii]
MAATLLPLSSQDGSRSRWSPPITIRHRLAFVKGKLRNSFTYTGRLSLCLVVTFMLLLIVQERHDISFRVSSRYSDSTPFTSITTTTPLNNDNSNKSNTDTVSSTQVSNRPLIYDIILCHTELDLLEIRLNELSHHVDWFVIIEAEQTFTGHPKPLYFRVNERRFEKFRRQILHIVLPAEEFDPKSTGWERERLTRNLGFWRTLDTHKPRDGDWLMISDMDELPRRSILQAMRDQDLSTENGRLFSDGAEGSGGDLFRFSCQLYYYSYEYLHTGSLWNGPVVARYRSSEYWTQETRFDDLHAEKMRELSSNDWREAGNRMRGLRESPLATYVNNSCFHCSWCFSTITQVISKVEAYSHFEHNQDRYKTRQWILDAVKEGRDLFERDLDKFVYVENNEDLPAYVSDHRKEFSYMLQRHNMTNAGFLDVNPENPLDETWKPTSLE